MKIKINKDKVEIRTNMIKTREEEQVGIQKMGIGRKKEEAIAKRE